jgi:hypothetical protein
MASGDYIAFLDADDEWLPAKLERQMDAVTAHPKAGAVSTTIVRVPEGRDWRPIVERHRREGIKILSFRQALFGWDFRLMPALLIRRDTFLDVGRLDESFRRSQDIEFCVRLMSMGYTILVVQDTPTIAWLGPAAGCTTLRAQLLGLRARLEILQRCAPDAPPPMGGILSEAEYRELVFPRAYRGGLSLMRYGELAEAESQLELAVACAAGRAARQRAQWLLRLTRWLRAHYGEQSDRVKRYCDILRGGGGLRQ